MLRALREQNAKVTNKGIRAGILVLNNSDLQGVTANFYEGGVAFSGDSRMKQLEPAQIAVMNLLVHNGYLRAHSWEDLVQGIRNYKGPFGHLSKAFADLLEDVLDEYSVNKTEPLSTISIERIKVNGKPWVYIKPYPSRK